jgi:hypothetical protein
MITELSKDELVVLGARNRADYLVEQAGYTLGLAALDGEALAGLLDEGYLKEVAAARDAVNAARQDRALMAQEAKDATKAHNVAAKAAKVWRRKAVRRALRAKRMGRAMPDELLAVREAKTIPALHAQMVEMVKLFEANLAAMPGKGADKLLQEGKDLAGMLSSSDAVQEVKRLKELPDAVKAFYAQKGLLYTGLKVVNDAGHELHAASAVNAARYNLSVLHRHGGNHGGGEEPAPAP